MYCRHTIPSFPVKYQHLYCVLENSLPKESTGAEAALPSLVYCHGGAHVSHQPPRVCTLDC
jgi:hypothetical protein